MKRHLRDNWFYYVCAVAIAIVVLVESRVNGDFDIFLSASKDMMLHKNIYQEYYHQYYHYYYDTFFALVLYPLTYLPVFLVKVFWLLLNVFFVYRLWKIIQMWLPLNLFSEKLQKVFVLLLFLFMASFLRDNFHLGQVTILILYLTIEGIYQINNGKIWLGCALLALGINIKILPIVFIPYLLYRAQWKPAFLVIGFMLVFFFVPSLFIGYDYNQTLLLERWELINPTNQEHVLDSSERSFHSLTTLLSTLFVADCGDWHSLPLRRHIADISIEKLQYVILTVRLFFIAFTLYFLATWPFKRVKNNLQLLYEVSYLCIVVPLIFPHQQHYSFLFIFPAISYILYYTLYVYFKNSESGQLKNIRSKKVIFLTFLSLAYFLTNSRLILGTFSEYYDHYKTLTYGVLIIVFLLAICKPSRLSAHT